ncbi:hypothetical protein D9M71_803900 [compost metagenome]
MPTATLQQFLQCALVVVALTHLCHCCIDLSTLRIISCFNKCLRQSHCQKCAFQQHRIQQHRTAKAIRLRIACVYGQSRSVTAGLPCCLQGIFLGGSPTRWAFVALCVITTFQQTVSTLITVPHRVPRA